MDNKKNTTSPYPAGVGKRAVQMVVDRLDGHARLTAEVRDIAGKKAGPPSAEKARAKAGRIGIRSSGSNPRRTERENRELWQAKGIPKKGEPMERQWPERPWRTLICPGGARPPVPQARA